ncbi:TRAP transporter large permease subunit [Ruegeria sp. ANG10]|uniref:TRAP transporter large permease subunit n=1 Tax=Ruegeria sp. ANG10 TaxID=3042467 RepID=UPI00345191EF
MISALRAGIWALLMPAILMDGIYSGYFSPTEAAAVAPAYAILVECVIYHELTLADLRDTAIETSITLGTIFPILAIALSMNLLLISHQVPAQLADWVRSAITSKITFLLAMNALLLIVGCLRGMMSAIAILAPLLVSLGRVYGIEPVHLGIVMIINLEIGLLTPPDRHQPDRRHERFPREVRVDRSRRPTLHRPNASWSTGCDVCASAIAWFRSIVYCPDVFSQSDTGV